MDSSSSPIPTCDLIGHDDSVLVMYMRHEELPSFGTFKMKPNLPGGTRMDRGVIGAGRSVPLVGAATSAVGLWFSVASVTIGGYDLLGFDIIYCEKEWMKNAAIYLARQSFILH